MVDHTMDDHEKMSYCIWGDTIDVLTMGLGVYLLMRLRDGWRLRVGIPLGLLRVLLCDLKTQSAELHSMLTLL